MLPLGTPLPNFALPEALQDGLSERHVSPSDFAGAAMLVMFICNHCPFVKHLRASLATFGEVYKPKGLAIVAINSNDVDAYPDDAPAKMALEKIQAGYSFPYVFDGSQHVARAFEAACTPDFYLFDTSHKLAYRGQYDDSRPGNGKPVTGADLRAAADAVLADRPVAANQVPSLGCNIKWKPAHN